jgi:hypothetical protein
MANNRFGVLIRPNAMGNEAVCSLSRVGVHLQQPANEWATEKVDADWHNNQLRRLESLLEAAYQEGHRDAKREIREALGVRNG